MRCLYIPDDKITNQGQTFMIHLHLCDISLLLNPFSL